MQTNNMDMLNTILNFLLPALTIIFLFLFYPFYLLIKLGSCLHKHLHFENIAGKVVLITGASSGIGETVDHLINNAGVPQKVIFEDFTQIQDANPIMDIKFWGTTYITYFAIPHLRKSKGKIIVITSAVANIALPLGSVYSASKAALLRFFETLRIELNPDIKITFFLPGVIATDMITPLFIEKSGSDFILSESVRKCAKAIFKGIGRGETYIEEPCWIKWVFLVKNTCPEIVGYVPNILFVRYLKPWYKRD